MCSESTPRQEWRRHALPRRPRIMLCRCSIGLMGSDIALAPLPIKKQDGRADPVEELFQSQQQWYCRRTVAKKMKFIIIIVFTR